MEPKENLCQPPEYPAEMFSEYIESAKARALRASEIEAILGDDYDLDRLRELVEADRDGRCIVLPCKVGDELFYSDGEWIGKETVEKIVIDIETDGGIYAPRDIGYSVYKSAEEAEAVLKEDQHGQDL